MSVDFCLLTIPRSGSEFLLRLIEAVVGPEKVRPTSGLTPGRGEKANALNEARYRDLRDEGRPMAYFAEVDVRSVKIEMPAKDDLAYRIADNYPSCVFVCSYRPFSKIASSHARLSWGLDPRTLIDEISAHVDFLDNFRRNNPVYCVDIVDRTRLNLARFQRFLGSDTDLHNPGFIDRWTPVNDHQFRAARDGGKSPEKGREQIDQNMLNAGVLLDKVLSRWVAEDNE